MHFNIPLGTINPNFYQDLGLALSLRAITRDGPWPWVPSAWKLALMSNKIILEVTALTYVHSH